MYVCSQEAVRASATVIEHGRSAKVIVFKKKRRKNYKRKRGIYMCIDIISIHVIPDHNSGA